MSAARFGAASLIGEQKRNSMPMIKVIEVHCGLLAVSGSALVSQPHRLTTGYPCDAAAYSTHSAGPLIGYCLVVRSIGNS